VCSVVDLFWHFLIVPAFMHTYTKKTQVQPSKLNFFFSDQLATNSLGSVTKGFLQVQKYINIIANILKLNHKRNCLITNWGLRMQWFSKNNVFKQHLPNLQVYRVTYNPCQVTVLSFVSEQRSKSILCDHIHGGHEQNFLVNKKNW